ncbi:unnamed protein product [Penicillium camemberti]|uniref:Str. FM013 n=1 Tax=Penicillium camemberti (strain FM 013) TaxID=1429867 RepID=A0A0G4P385_PENC3|nr:unnamed protein product [Penicillium camemberti]
MIEGVAWTTQPFIQVRWQWLALPAVPLVTVMKTRNRVIWKSSTLAPLFTDVSIQIGHGGIDFKLVSRPG